MCLTSLQEVFIILVYLYTTYTYSTTNKSPEALVAVVQPATLLRVVPSITTLPTYPPRPHSPRQTSLTSLSQPSNTSLLTQPKIKVNLQVPRAELTRHTCTLITLTVNYSLMVESNHHLVLLVVVVKGHPNRYHRVTSLTTHTITLHTLTSLRAAAQWWRDQVRLSHSTCLTPSWLFWHQCRPQSRPMFIMRMGSIT